MGDQNQAEQLLHAAPSNADQTSGKVTQNTQSGSAAGTNAENVEDGLQAGILASLPSFQSQHLRLLRIGTAIMLAILAAEWIYIANQKPDPLLLQRGDSFHSQFHIDVNNATWVEWLQMEGIGPSLAHRIVADRKLNGPYKSIDDVRRVPGIGPATLDRIRPWLTISHDLNDTQSTDAASARPSDKPSAANHR